MDNTKNLTILSLCTGYGGLELGLSAALANPLRVVAVEVEAYALANLVAKAEEGKLAIEALWPDLKTFPAERFRGCFDFITGGFPCQPFSCAGKRAGTDDPRHLWPHIARIVQAVEPLWCFFENVAGHLTLGFPEVYRSLRDMGYSVEAGLFTAAEVGAPHRRQRLFILAESSQCNGQRGAAWLRWRSGQSSKVGKGGRLRGADKRARPDDTTGPPSQLAESSGATSGGENREAQREARSENVRQGDGKACPIRLRPASQLADTETTRLQRQEPTGNTQAGRCPDEHGRTYWPARPGQPQYEWEEPRVVANAHSAGNRRSGAKTMQDSNELQDGISDSNSEHEAGQAE